MIDRGKTTAAAAEESNSIRNVCAISGAKKKYGGNARRSALADLFRTLLIEARIRADSNFAARSMGSTPSSLLCFRRRLIWKRVNRDLPQLEPVRPKTAPFSELYTNNLKLSQPSISGGGRWNCSPMVFFSSMARGAEEQRGYAWKMQNSHSVLPRTRRWRTNK